MYWLLQLSCFLYIVGVFVFQAILQVLLYCTAYKCFETEVFPNTSLSIWNIMSHNGAIYWRLLNYENSGNTMACI